MLGALFGLPESEFLRLRHWLDDFFLREKAVDGREPKQAVAMRNLRAYLDRLLAERVAHSGGDLMSAMLGVRDEGERLSDDQVVVTTMTFLTAGFESVNNFLTNTVRALALDTEARRRVRDDLTLLPAALEEVMRWDAPAQGFVRTPTHDVELRDTTIPEGAQVLVHIGAANRDPERFPDPDRFDIDRDTQRHLGLGHGNHFCVGAPLARSMGRILFEELLARSKAWEVDLAGGVRVTTPNFRGFSVLPVRP